jgi:uncharacterized membrane protein YphA (DoxX/SURF4 family)
MDTSAKVLRWAAIVLRTALAGIFIYAAYTKLRDPWQVFAMSIATFQFFPPWMEELAARTLPTIELIVGLVLLSGRLPRTAAAASSLLLLVFNFLIVRAYLRKDQVDCGCFGPGGVLDWKKLVEDGSMLAASLFVLAVAIRNRRKPA